MSRYIDTVNSEIKEYFDMACDNDYPDFIDKYIELKELQRLKYIGQFCGCDYTKLHSVKYWYSRLDHSIICALMTWHFTKDKKQTLAALFHDLGTPAFSHCIDFMLGDTVNQESSEHSVTDVLDSSPIIKEYLNKEGLTIDDVTGIDKYTILENKKPKLCVDRLDGILHTVLIWLHTWSISKVKEVYDNIVVLTNEDNKLEIGFKDLEAAEKFFEAMYQYSIILQQNENKFTVQFIADNLKKLIDGKILSIDELYLRPEEEILNLIKKHNQDRWPIFESSTTIKRSEDKPTNNYYVSIETKKRYVNPLCLFNNETYRVCDISNTCKNLLESYLNYHDSKYAYIDGLDIE